MPENGIDDPDLATAGAETARTAVAELNYQVRDGTAKVTTYVTNNAGGELFTATATVATGLTATNVSAIMPDREVAFAAMPPRRDDRSPNRRDRPDRRPTPRSLRMPSSKARQRPPDLRVHPRCDDRSNSVAGYSPSPCGRSLSMRRCSATGWSRAAARCSPKRWRRPISTDRLWTNGPGDIVLMRTSSSF